MKASPAPGPIHRRKRITQSEAQINGVTSWTQGEQAAKQLYADIGYCETAYRNIIQREGQFPEAYKNLSHLTEWYQDYLDILGQIVRPNPLGRSKRCFLLRSIHGM
jgi:hypothetical protein